MRLFELGLELGGILQIFQVSILGLTFPKRGRQLPDIFAFLFESWDILTFSVKMYCIYDLTNSIDFLVFVNVIVSLLWKVHFFSSVGNVFAKSFSTLFVSEMSFFFSGQLFLPLNWCSGPKNTWWDGNSSYPLVYILSKKSFPKSL